ncbi:ATP-binding protein [Rhodococcus gordoniae]
MAEDDVVDVIKLKPDAGFVRSLGAHHTLPSAIADLVDNSVDANSNRVVIRLLTKKDHLVQVEIVDNGRGMSETEIDKSMTLGHRREYGGSDLGHFGIGMKAASLSHSDVLTVWSLSEGSQAVGRRIRRDDFARDYSCERLTQRAASAAARRRDHIVGSKRGTSVVWTALRDGVYSGSNREEAQIWMADIERTIRQHLGVTFHRLISSGALRIEILVDELDAADGIGTPVAPVNPFGYPTSGRPGYPKTLVADVAGKKVQVTCHIWPAKRDVPGFRIFGEQGQHFQGFYIYRNDRLLQIGGWSNMASKSMKRQLARVVIDDPNAVGTFLTMNPEKSGLGFEPAFKAALAVAKSKDGTTFDRYLTDAETAYSEGSKRNRRRQPVISPDRGFAPGLRRAIKAELPLKRGENLKILWKRLPRGEFIDVDFKEKTLWINQRYRPLFAPEGGSMNDSPVLKSLLFLLTHQVFEGAHLGPKDKDNIALWGAILGEAVELEQAMREGAKD